MNNSFHDSLRFDESLSISSDGRMVAKRHTSGHIVGLLEVNEVDKFGNVLFTDKSQNDITIAGSTFILEQMFKVKSSNSRFNMTDLGSDYATEASSDTDINDECVFGFMVGVGGEISVGPTSPSYKTTRISSADGSASFVPFRIQGFGSSDNFKISADGTDGNDYTGMYVVPAKTIGNAEGYFVKTFDSAPIIVPEYADGSSLAVTDAFSESDSPIYTYCQINMSLTKDDIRDYFLQRYGTIDNCQVNQLGLVAGKITKAAGKISVKDLKLVTTVNFKGRDLSNNENTFKMRYKIYCL